MTSQRVVVVGAGHAGGSFVALLRQGGFDGDVVMIGAEEHLPYHRPPLSKSFGDSTPIMWLRDACFYGENGIVTKLGETATAIDRQAKTVRLASGAEVAYDVLVLATGAEPRRLPLPGDGLDGIHTLRTLADAVALREAIASGQPLVIIGGGYVGLEVAAAARGRGVDVTIIEREKRVLNRVASPLLSGLLSDHHRAQGTRILTAAEIAGFTCDRGRVGGVRLADGTEIGGGFVLVGVGAAPRDTLASAAGLACAGGIVVDDMARTSDPSILAIGDVTNRPVGDGATAVGRMRLESIPSAIEQAKQAAAGILGSPRDTLDVPWFWSDQFDLKIKIAGIVRGNFETVVRGKASSGSYALFHHDAGRLVAAETVNAPRDFMAAKRILSAGGRIDPDALADPAVDLRTLQAA
jgi:3-phenylpropionate/trans-cinnamate dioxygenase ferredoxin reductase subunit